MGRHPILTNLLLDDCFQSWVLSGGKENSRYWKSWLLAHPEQEEIFHEAKAILLGLQEARVQLPTSRKEALRQKIIRMAQPDQAASDRSRVTERSLGGHWLSVAAAVMVLLVMSVLLYRFGGNYAKEKEFATTYGEIKTITLPDSSRVTLNGNSSIRYSYQEQVTAPREVWLEGEAFFEVRKKKAATDGGHALAIRFIVHTENLSVQVLGTRFNVRHRRDQTQVVLEEGSVQLALEEQGRSWLMAPDELVEVHKGEKQINPQPVRAEDYTAWREGFIHFEGASFSDISQLLADNYDLTLHFENKEQASDINLKGSFPAHTIDVLLEAIANVTHTSIKKEGKTIIYQ